MVSNPPPPTLPFASFERSGGYLTPLGSLNNTGFILNRVYYAPLWVGKTTSFDRASVRIAGAAAAGGIARLGIYSDGGTGGPGALVVELGTVPTDVAATAVLTIAQTLPPGLYWLALVGQVTIVGGSIFAIATWGGLAEGADMSAANTGFVQDGVAGALPAQATPNFAGGSQSSTPTFGLRVA